MPANASKQASKQASNRNTAQVRSWGTPKPKPNGPREGLAIGRRMRPKREGRGGRVRCALCYGHGQQSRRDDGETEPRSCLLFLFLFFFVFFKQQQPRRQQGQGSEVRRWGGSQRLHVAQVAVSVSVPLTVQRKKKKAKPSK